MTPRERRRKSVTERLRAIARGSDDDAPPVRRSRVHQISFERSHRDTVWIPPDPPRRWYEDQGLEPMPIPDATKRRWWRR